LSKIGCPRDNDLSYESVQLLYSQSVKPKY